MRYSNAVFEKTINELNIRKRTAEEICEKRIAEVEEKFPEIKRLNNKISNVKYELTQAFSLDNFSQAMQKISNENLSAQKKRTELLEAFGYPKNYFDVSYSCRLCHDTGFVGGKRCPCFDELLTKYSIEELNSNCRIVLNDFQAFKLDVYGESEKPIMERVYKECLKYVDNFKKNSDSLLFIGSTGLGKTMLSSAIAKGVISKGFNVAYDSISNFLRKIENEHFGRSSESTMDLLLSADLVILDDLGSEFQSPFNNSSLYDIINTRINYGLPTIISTNYSHKELNEKYNERIISRLFGMYIPVKFVGKDVRQIKRRHE